MNNLILYLSFIFVRNNLTETTLQWMLAMKYSYRGYKTKYNRLLRFVFKDILKPYIRNMYIILREYLVVDLTFSHRN